MKVQEPKCVERTYVQTLSAPPEEVFPLLCPVRETEWAEGWDPEIVYSKTGFAEQGCVFVTREGTEETVWVITRHEVEQLALEMIHVTPGHTVCRLNIELAPNSSGGTDATVTYSHTAIGPDGETIVEEFSDSHYKRFMRQWERELDDYLLANRAL